MQKLVMGCCLFLLCMTASAQSVLLKNIRYREHEHGSRIVFELSGPYQYHAFSLSDPDRFVVDFKKTRLLTAVNRLPFQNTGILALRASTTPDQCRLVFDTTSPMHPTISRQDNAARHQYQLVVEFQQNTGTVIHPRKQTHSHKTPMTFATPPAPQPIHYQTSTMKPILQNRQQQASRDVIVVIDPGHGGKDPGAAGGRGTQEKRVVLEMSKALQREINHQKGMRAYLTRDGDYYIGLRERLNIARKRRADIFIAVHADAFMKRSSHGASVFALSQRGASSEAASWLATRENHSELGDASLMDKGYMLRSVLIDLSQTATISASLHLGREVLDEIGKIATLHNRKVEQAGFVVLKSPDIPSILIETGFISNPVEEMHLQNSRFQRQLAIGVTRGIKDYFMRYPPRNSLFAAYNGGRTQW